MLSVFIRTVIIYLFLSFILKIMGKRQIGELEVSELVSTLLISEIASAPITDPNIPLFFALIPVLFIGLLEIGLSALKNKWGALKRVLEGEPVYIIFKGKLRQRALEENRISINEILTEMRVQGIANPSDVYYAILEQNGKLSLLSKEDGDDAAYPLIIDGVVENKNLKELGLDKDWLEKKLSEKELTENEIFLMTVTDSGAINIIRKDIK